jgi:hypothetical protein
MDIDLGDLPSEEEFAEADAAGAEQGSLGEPTYSSGPMGGEAPGLLALFQTWVTLVAILYLVAGLLVGAVFAFGGAAEAGIAALAHPGFYLLVLFWPIALWKLVLNQY